MFWDKVAFAYDFFENTYNGKTTMRHELRWFCSDDKVDTAAIPKPKYEKKKAAATSGSGDFMSIPDGEEEDLPF